MSRIIIYSIVILVLSSFYFLFIGFAGDRIFSLQESFIANRREKERSAKDINRDRTAWFYTFDGVCPEGWVLQRSIHTLDNHSGKCMRSD